MVKNVAIFLFFCVISFCSQAFCDENSWRVRVMALADQGVEFDAVIARDNVDEELKGQKGLLERNFEVTESVDGLFFSETQTGTLRVALFVDEDLVGYGELNKETGLVTVHASKKNPPAPIPQPWPSWIPVVSKTPTGVVSAAPTSAGGGGGGGCSFGLAGAASLLLLPLLLCVRR